MNCTPKGTEPVVGVAENLASGAGVPEVLGALGVLLQPVKAANASVIKAKTVTIFAIAVHQLLECIPFSAPDRRSSNGLRWSIRPG